jgi:hypothetical protein
MLSAVILVWRDFHTKFREYPYLSSDETDVLEKNMGFELWVGNHLSF